MHVNSFPRQKLPYSKKVANDYEWAKQCIDYILNHFPPFFFYGGDLARRVKANYDLYNNIIDERDFARDCNPLGLEIGQIKDEIRLFNKTYNKIQILLGEELRRPFVHKVTLIDSASLAEKENRYDELLRAYIENVVFEKGEDTLDPLQIREYMLTTYQEEREKLASALLDYLRVRLDLTQVKNEAFKDALLSGFEVVKLSDEEPAIEVINPLRFSFKASPQQVYIQDSDFAFHYYYTTTASLESAYDFTEEEEEILTRFDKERILVECVEWKSLRRVGFLTIYPPDDVPYTILVDDAFKAPSIREKYVIDGKTHYRWDDPTTNIVYRLYYDWVEEVWKGKRIARKIYRDIGPLKYQIRSSDNLYAAKLTYHGRVYVSANDEVVSMMDRMRPFAYLYIVVAHKLRKFIVNDRGVVLPFDVSMIDPKVGLEKTLYYLSELGIDFYNPLHNADQLGAAQRGKVSGTINASNVNIISAYIQLLSALDMHLAEISGVNRQREGQVRPDEAVGNAAFNAQVSSIITSTLFYTHDKLWEKILTSLLHLARKYYSDNPSRVSYVLDDLSSFVLNLSNEEALSDGEIGVFVQDNLNYMQMLNTLQSLIGVLISSNKASLKDVIALYSAKSLEQLKNLLAASEQLARETEQAMLQQQLETQKEIERMQAETKLEVARIQSTRFAQAQDVNENEIPDRVEVVREQVKLRDN